MGVPMLRNLVCCVMIAVFPASLIAADTSAAMLHAGGSTWLNGSTVPRTSAIFPGDLVETNPGAAANINAPGSSVTIEPASLIKFEGNAISVQHGAASVATSKGMAAHAGDVTITPASEKWTEFEVQNVNGTVQIAARTGDVAVREGDDTSTLPEGQQTTRDESDNKKKKRRKAGGAIPASGGPVLDSPIAIWTGVGIVGGVVLWVMLRGDDPMSDDSPSKAGMGR